MNRPEIENLIKNRDVIIDDAIDLDDKRRG